MSKKKPKKLDTSSSSSEFSDLLNSLSDEDWKKHFKEKKKHEKKQALPSRQPLKPLEIDLHGLNVKEAKAFLSSKIEALLLEFRGQKFTLRIITGRGLHSDPILGAVLPQEIYEFTSKRYASMIVEIDTAPHESKLGGVQLRGYFNVTLKKG